METENINDLKACIIFNDNLKLNFCNLFCGFDMRAYDLGRLYLSLPKAGEFRAGHFASNPDDARRIGKMLTELEKAGLLVSRKKDVTGSKFYEHAEKIVRDTDNMTILRCLEHEQRLRAELRTPSFKESRKQ